MSSSKSANDPVLAASPGSGHVVVADGWKDRRATGVQPAHGDQAEPEVADFGQQPMQRGLVSEQAADDRLVALAADLEAVEPGRPPAVQDTRHADLVLGRPVGGARRSCFLHLWTVGADAR